MSNKLNMSRGHDHHDHDHHHDDEEDFLAEETRSFNIFDVKEFSLNEPVPTGFDAVRIELDGCVKSGLTWKKEIDAARHYVEQGLYLLWDLNLGLFDSLDRPLGDPLQFQALALSLEHFRDAVWKDFRDHTVGLSLYRGSLDFSIGYRWDEEQGKNLQEWIEDAFLEVENLTQYLGLPFPNGWGEVKPDLLKTTPEGQILLQLFCCDVGGEYLDLLAARLPDTLPLFVFFDATEVEDSYLIARMISKERYPRFHVGIKESVCAFDQSLGGNIAWEGVSLPHGILSRGPISEAKHQRARTAICLPKISLRNPLCHSKLGRELDLLIQKKEPFRVISECYLSSEWDGLDTLIIDDATIDTILRRKLDGFVAAGGMTSFAR